MTREKAIKMLIEDASKHNPEEVTHYIAGYREDNVYLIERIEDFEEWRQLHKNSNGNRFADEMEDEFRQYIGKTWINPKTGNHYKIIGLEDNNAWMDWYWVIQNIDDDRDISHELANDTGFYKNFVNS